MNFNNAEFIASYMNFSDIPKHEGVEIAFSGRSNVGKSSLINKIVNRKSLARTSAMPGKTASINMYDVDGLKLVDLPGYGYAKVSKSEKKRWATLIENYFHKSENLQLVFQLVDFRHPPTADDKIMINFLIDSEIPFVVILTKSDKLSKKQRADRRTSLLSELECAEDITFIEFSAQNGEGVEDIRGIIEDIFYN